MLKNDVCFLFSRDGWSEFHLPLYNCNEMSYKMKDMDVLGVCSTSSTLDSFSCFFFFFNYVFSFIIVCFSVH